MAVETMTRRASDNAYLHRDFHGALSTGLAYLESRHGPEAVRAYVTHFARTYYAPLTHAIRDKGLGVLRDRLETVYAQEGGRIRISFTEDEMLLEVEECPAVMHMRRAGYAVAPLFFETSRTLYEAILDGTPYASEWLRHEPETGRCAVRFFRRTS